MLNRTLFFLILSTLALFIFSCIDKEEHLHFKLPNGMIINQVTINELEKNQKIIYEQYNGFTGNYEDSILKDCKILYMVDEKNKIANGLLSKEKINNYKNEIIKNIKIIYIIEKNTQERDSNLEQYIKSRYEYDEEKQIKNGFILFKDNQEILKFEFFNIGRPLYTVVVYPVNDE